MTNSTPALIPLWRNELLASFALVDQEDYLELSKLDWYLSKTGYASSKIGYMHRVILSTPDGEVVDHINGVRLDNRKVNLRSVSHAKNNMNRRTKAKFKGIAFDKRDKKYSAGIARDGIKYGLGRYETAKEAALAYDSAARQIHGEFAFVNFPDEYEFQDMDWKTLAQGRGVASRRYLTMEDARDIRKRAAAGEKQISISKSYQVNPGIVSMIISNLSYQERDTAVTASAISLMQQGLNDSEIARQLKLARWTVNAIREENKHLNFPDPKSIVPTRRRISIEQREQAVKAFLGGRKGFEVAAEYGISPQYLSRFVRDYKAKYPNWQETI